MITSLPNFLEHSNLYTAKGDKKYQPCVARVRERRKTQRNSIKGKKKS